MYNDKRLSIPLELLLTLGVEPAVETDDEKSQGVRKYRELMSQPLVHLAALFIFVYVGVEVRIYSLLDRDYSTDALE